MKLDLLRGCKLATSCQQSWATPRCWAWRLSICTTPDGHSARRSERQIEQQHLGRGLWNSQDLQENKIKYEWDSSGMVNRLMWEIESYSWHVYSAHKYAYHLACGGMTRHLVPPSLEWVEGSWWQDRLCFLTSLVQDHCFCLLQPQTQLEHHHLRKSIDELVHIINNICGIFHLDSN